MSTILSQAEIADIQRQVAPQRGDDIVEVWRMPSSATPVIGGSGVDKYGMPVTTGINPARPDQKAVKVQTLYCRIATATGNEQAFGGQMVSLAPFVVSFNEADNPDIRGGDWLVRLTKRSENVTVATVGWRAGFAYVQGVEEEPLIANSFYYRATVGGISGSTSPAWPTVIGVTVVDGSVTWQCVGKRQRLEVKDAGGQGTIAIERLVRCVEVKA